MKWDDWDGIKPPNSTRLMMFGDLSPFGDSVIFAHQNISTDPSLRNFWL
jgi:hypothetical protein